MRMRLLNLDRSTDRLALFRSRNPHHANIHRISATDGREANRQRLIENLVINPELSYTDGALGCALSHLTQWRDAIQTNSVLTIIEDDAVLCANFEEEASRIIASLPEDWEYVMWGYNFDAPLHYHLGPSLSPCAAHFNQEVLRAKIGEFSAIPITSAPFRLISGFGTVCYSISPRGAMRMLDFCMPLRPLETYYPTLGRGIRNNGIDIMLAQVWPNVSAYVAIPPLAVTENEQTSSTVQPSATTSRLIACTLPADTLSEIFVGIGTTDKTAIGVREDEGVALNTAALRATGWQGFDIAVQPDMVARALRDRAVSEEFDLLQIGALNASFHVLHTLLQNFRPRAVVVPVNTALGDEDYVAPFRPAPSIEPETPRGSSKAAFAQLAQKFGYQIFACPGTTDHALLLRADVHRQGKEPWPEFSRRHRSADTPVDRMAIGEVLSLPGYLTSEHYLLDGVSVAFTRYGKISYFENDRYIGQVFAAGGYWEEELVSRIAFTLQAASGLALDIGAHVGSHSIFLAQSNPNLSFCCFEPQRPLFLLLQRNIYENGLAGRIEPVWSAVGHRSGTFGMSKLLDEDGRVQDVRHVGEERVNLGGVQLGADGEPCPIIRIDDLQLPKVCYVKLDVEGAETLAVDGMKQLLAASKPFVFFEDRADRTLSEPTLDALAVPAILRQQTPSEQLRALSYSIEKFGIDFLARPSCEVNVERPSETTSATRFIPRRIFQTWKSKTDLPPNFAMWSRSFRDFNPDYTYVISDDADNRAFIAEHFPWFLGIYDAYPQEIMRADVVRYFQLFLHGGFYADMDAECLRPLDHLLDAGDIVLARMGPDPSHPHSIPNAMMGSRPRQEFWLLVFWLLVLTADQKGNVETRTGPVMLKSAVDLWNAADSLLVPLAVATAKSWLSQEFQVVKQTRRLSILPPRRWYGLDWTDPAHQLLRMQILGGHLLDASAKTSLFGQADMVTYWSHSW